MEVLIYIDFIAWLCFFAPHCTIKICRNQNSSQKKKNTSEFTILFSENTWNSIRSQIIMVATYLLGFKASLHQWEKKNYWNPLNTRTWLLAQGEPDLQIAGMVDTKVTLAALGSFPVPQLSSASPALDKWGGLTQKKLAYALFFYVMLRLMFAGDCSHSDIAQKYSAK